MENMNIYIYIYNNIIPWYAFVRASSLSNISRDSAFLSGRV